MPRYKFHRYQLLCYIFLRIMFQNVHLYVFKFGSDTPTRHLVWIAGGQDKYVYDL